MSRYIARRLILAPFVLLAMTFVTFAITQLIPVDPAAAYLGGRGGPPGPREERMLELLRERWGWDEPILVRYGLYVRNLLQGDLGESFTTRRPVSTDLAAFFPPSLELVLAAMLVALAIGIPVGVVAAARRTFWVDGSFKVVSTLAVSTPVFWLALISLNLFYRRLGIAAGPGRLDLFIEPPPRVTGLFVVDSLLAGRFDALFNALHHLALPAGLLGVVVGLYFARIVRSEMVDALESDYVRTARGKGLLGVTILFRHALKNAIIPTVTLSGLAFGSLLTGVIVVEHIVGWPGLGEYTFQAATKLDLNAISGVVLVMGVVYVLLNLLIDVLYAVIDPRVRLGRRAEVL